MFDLPPVTDIVAAALAEDLGVPAARFADDAQADSSILERDVTGWITMGPDEQFSGVVVARQDCVVCGLPVAAAVFETLSAAADLFDPVDFFPLVAEGAHVTAGTPIAEVQGVAVAVLAGERTALDFLMVLSGIATTTAAWVDLAGERMSICDTRKTVPGLRSLSKYAVRVGGGTNHRVGLYDMVLVKDNHLRQTQGVAEAIAQVRATASDLDIEIEADTLEQAVEAVAAGADWVLLDNMDDETLAEAVDACREAAGRRNRPVGLEASGGIARERVPLLRMTGVDRISSSAITLGAAPVDFGLDEGRG